MCIVVWHTITLWYNSFMSAMWYFTLVTGTSICVLMPATGSTRTGLSTVHSTILFVHVMPHAHEASRDPRRDGEPS